MESNNFAFNFPFKPYDIQLNLMNKIYDTLQNKEIGIFSSPTGTGKSLSLICSILTWLEDFKIEQRNLTKKNLDELNEKIIAIKNEKTSDWIDQHRRKMKIDDQKIEWMELNKKIEKFDLRTKELKSRKQTYVKKRTPFVLNKKKKTDDLELESNTIKEENDENLINYNSDDDNQQSDNEQKTDEEDNYVKPKIIYCSRTHSQLSQFISEIQKTIFKDKIRLIALGSRMNLCINSDVNKIKNISIINDKCMDLQRKSKQQRCCFKKQTDLNNLKDELLSNIMDIEDAYDVGRQLKACPYYASRYAIEETELVIVPYNVLLHENTRKSYNLSLDESIVIIDEAHNLLDTISSIYTVEIKGGQFMDSLNQLTQYQLRYNTKLNAKNMMHIKQLIAIINSFIKFLQNLDDSKILTIAELNLDCHIENFNIYDLIDFCEKVQLPRKLFGFVQTKAVQQINSTNNNSKSLSTSSTLSFLERMKENQLTKTATSKKIKTKSNDKKTNENKNENKDENKSENIIKKQDKPTSHLYQILEFFKALTNKLEDGRVLIKMDKQSVRESSYKFVLLNPARKFNDILEQTRSVILIGGTMEPISQFTDTLFGGSNCIKRMNQFACDHVIPDENLFVSAITSGPNQIKFDFSYQQRSNNKMLTELGDLLVNVCDIVKGGIVVFFVSYDFEDKIYKYFQSNKFIDKFEKFGKKIYREPRNSNDVNQILSNYTESVYNGVANSKNLNNKSTGAILFSVVGGKMSEGRCVVMVGLPYANIKSIELKEKMNYIEKQNGKKSANEYYENLCMKAVNQAIGRSIRHQKDYSSILLVDHRFANKESVINSLPNWIKKRYQAHNNFNDYLSSLKKFFQNKR